METYAEIVSGGCFSVMNKLKALHEGTVMFSEKLASESIQADENRASDHIQSIITASVDTAEVSGVLHGLNSLLIISSCFRFDR